MSDAPIGIEPVIWKRIQDVARLRGKKVEDVLSECLMYDNHHLRLSEGDRFWLGVEEADDRVAYLNETISGLLDRVDRLERQLERVRDHANRTSVNLADLQRKLKRKKRSK